MEIHLKSKESGSNVGQRKKNCDGETDKQTNRQDRDT